MKTKHRPIKRKLSIDLSMECDGNGVCKKQCPVSLDVLSIGNTTDVNLNGPERRHIAKDSACVRNHDSEVLANATEHKNEENNYINTNLTRKDFQTNVVSSGNSSHGDMLTCDNIDVEQCEHQERKRPNEVLNSTNCQNTDMPNTKRRRMINNNHYGERPLSKGNDQDSSINLQADTIGKWCNRNWRKLSVDPIIMHYLNGKPVSSLTRKKLDMRKKNNYGHKLGRKEFKSSNGHVNKGLEEYFVKGMGTYGLPDIV
ncbi:DNA helicase [Tanacetum coccineum]